jgi:uncharacterized membrane protein YgcG
MKKALSVPCVILIAAFVACEPSAIIQSKWTDSDTLFQNDPGQWKDAVEYPKDPQFGIGVKNNGKYLFLCMTSWKREVNGAISRFGFTTWFSSPSKKGKKFGIHFPMGGMHNGPGWRHRRDRNGDPDAAQAKMEDFFQEMELLGPEKSDSVPVRKAVAESFGISTHLFPSEENLVYLMRIPLNSDSVSKFAIDLASDTLVTVSFETDMPVFGHNREEGENRRPPQSGIDAEGGGMNEHSGMNEDGGMNGGGGRHGGGGMRGGGHRGSSSPAENVEQFSAGFTIWLAKAPLK